MKKIIYLIYSLLVSTTIFPIFDLSPWIIIENKTKLDLVCKIEAMCYPSDNEKITLFMNNDSNFNITLDQDQDKDENEFLKITINFVCNAKQTTVFNPMFYEDDAMFNPQVTAIEFMHQSLQLSTFCHPTNINQRYFSIAYQPEHGIITSMHTISTYIKCLSNFKQTVRNLIVAALNATNWLPY